MLTKVVVCLIASLFAGIGTGLAGMSAAVAIAPLLMTFLGTSHFDAVTVSLASDVLASLLGFIAYKKAKNVDIKNALVLMISIIVFTFVGTIAGWFAEKYFGTTVMWYGTVITIALMGFKLTFFPKTKLDESEEMSTRRRIVISLLFGTLIGFVCGFVGAGGGMMMLFALTVFLGYDLHKSVGTSLLIMTCTAFIGGVFHIVFEGAAIGFSFANVDFVVLILCVAFTLIFSVIASNIANRISEKKLNLISGVMLIVIAAVVVIFNVIKL